MGARTIDGLQPHRIRIVMTGQDSVATAEMISGDVEKKTI
jgi:hypothetical protein